jgi:hypothetical protein
VSSAFLFGSTTADVLLGSTTPELLSVPAGGFVYVGSVVVPPPAPVLISSLWLLY